MALCKPKGTAPWHLHLSTVPVQVLPKNVFFCDWKVACTDWKIQWVMFSEGREGKNSLRFVSLGFLQSWLRYKVLLL